VGFKGVKMMESPPFLGSGSVCNSWSSEENA